eukprot:754978-Hanusia_phi.AAC.8
MATEERGKKLREASEWCEQGLASMEVLLGKDVTPTVGQDTPLTAGMVQGCGTVIGVHANGGYCSVRWDNGQEEKVVFTGQRVRTTDNSVLSRLLTLFARFGLNREIISWCWMKEADLCRLRVKSLSCEIQAVGLFVNALDSDAGDDSVSSANLHKQLLAQEVVKLRREVAQLRASGGSEAPDSSHALRQAQIEIARLEAQKAEVIAQANAQKAVLAKEVHYPLAVTHKFFIRYSGQEPSSGTGEICGENAQTDDLVDTLQKRKEFEENFTRTLRDLRKELENTSIKSLSSKGQLSNERIEKVMEEAAQGHKEQLLILRVDLMGGLSENRSNIDCKMI